MPGLRGDPLGRRRQANAQPLFGDPRVGREQLRLVTGGGPAVDACGGLSADDLGESGLELRRVLNHSGTVDGLVRFDPAAGEATHGAALLRQKTGDRPALESADTEYQATVALATIPELVGYQSSVGFHLAFRKMFDLPPGEFRRQAQESDTRVLEGAGQR
ncbi:hypothetical protein [Streptomyces sp. NPDC051162]|uniref:hypothetical protein n=1 Tax=Streptomyces sp. NPDC051162 TaxID=3154747 RepID=UPI003426F816